MIIRKPYAFFIKNFKKIHILLLVLSLIVFFYQSRISSFVREFIKLQTYDPNNFPITKYIPTYLLLLVLLLFLLCLMFTIVLKRKSKPWKLYLIPTIAYALMFLMYVIIRAYFLTYTGTETTAEISLYRDILLFASLAQLPTFVIFLVRILGLDLRKFNFQTDAEYLELEESDQEEVEININIDKESFRRTFYRTIRNLKYFYLEHKKICYAAGVVLGIIFLRQAYLFIFVNNRVYRQNQDYNVDGYTFVINDSYYTDKKYNGVVISNKNAFVVVNLSVKNNSEKREFNTGNFHLLNGVNNYISADQTYETEFEDLGNPYDGKAIDTDKTIKILLIFRVDKNLSKDRFVLMYQEKGLNLKLRKIKLKIEDLSKITDSKLKVGEPMKVRLGELKESISVDEYIFYSNVNYKYRECVHDECTVYKENVVAPEGKKIVGISFGTDEIESKDLIDFSTRYGKIIYIDNKGEKVEVPMENALPRANKGKTFYTLVPSEASEAKKFNMEFTVRNKRFIYGWEN